jgi:hypothetical protein
MAQQAKDGRVRGVEVECGDDDDDSWKFDSGLLMLVAALELASGGGYGSASKAWAMFNAAARQIREDSCLLKGRVMLFFFCSDWAQHGSPKGSEESADSRLFASRPPGAFCEDWGWSHAQEVSHSARSSTKPMSKFVGACFKSQYGLEKTGRSEKALYLWILMRALMRAVLVASITFSTCGMQTHLLSFTVDMHLKARAAVASGSVAWLNSGCAPSLVNVTTLSMRR